jgi:hypothetical protein
MRSPIASAILDGDAVAGDGSEGIQAAFEARHRAGSPVAFAAFHPLETPRPPGHKPSPGQPGRSVSSAVHPDRPRAIRDQPLLAGRARRGGDDEGQFVLITDEDLAKARVEATQAIDVRDFVPADAIPWTFSRTPTTSNGRTKGVAPTRSCGRRSRKVDGSGSGPLSFDSGSCACGSSGARGWGRDGLGTGARGRGARARRFMLPSMKRLAVSTRDSIPPGLRSVRFTAGLCQWADLARFCQPSIRAHQGRAQ